VRQAFGGCVLDRDSRELTRDGSLVHASPKLLALLELLIDAAPRAVPKDEIHKAIWPGTFVAEATLTSLVAELRDAIGDKARTPRLLRTVHGYGYSFIGEVKGARAARRTDVSRTYRVVVGDRELALESGEHIIGRSPDVEIFVDDSGVSRQHACITIDVNGATLADLRSKNGTTLDGNALTGPAALADGALIVVGATVLKFRMFTAASSTETVTRHD
jgi:DNA-binding winged helix-turn-helix (wHTH) protein